MLRHSRDKCATQSQRENERENKITFWWHNGTLSLWQYESFIYGAHFVRCESIPNWMEQSTKQTRCAHDMWEKDRYYYAHFTIMMKSFTHIPNLTWCNNNRNDSKFHRKAPMNSEQWIVNSELCALHPNAYQPYQQIFTLFYCSQFKRVYKFDILDRFLLLLI